LEDGNKMSQEKNKTPIGGILLAGIIMTAMIAGVFITFSGWDRQQIKEALPSLKDACKIDYDKINSRINESFSCVCKPYVELGEVRKIYMDQENNVLKEVIEWSDGKRMVIE
jgi:hypothetical protein